MSASHPGDAGLCEDCLHARRITSARGSVFVLCGMHERDARFAKYPRLPMGQCPGHRTRPPPASS